MKLLPLFLLLVACSGCPPQPIPTKLDAAMPSPAPDMEENYGLMACPMSPDITFANVCDGMFTAAGLACVQCPGMGACLDQQDVIYCAAGSNCAIDPTCVQVNDGEDGSPGSKSKRKIKRRTIALPSKLKVTP